jgi:diguanylate cyclase (GGDEF)-like protein
LSSVRPERTTARQNPARAVVDGIASEIAGRVRDSDRDVLVLAITLAAIMLFVATGGSAMTEVARAVAGIGLGPDQLLTTALLLNVALVIFGWRRYDQLSAEVAERRRAEEHARLLAETDALTGLLNRRSIGPHTDRLVSEAQAQGRAVAFVMIDLDNFKQINDCHGHAVGDALLVECARRIADVVPAGALVARLGGDEFACVVAFESARGDLVDALAERITGVVSAPLAIGSFQGHVTVSIGLTRSDGHGAGKGAGEAISAAGLLHMADIAMYQAKKQGRNRHLWFEGTMESEIRYRSDLEGALRRGIATCEFVPYYEQQVDLATGRLTGFEMLARWQSPLLGPIGPEVFIPIAEEIGVIGELSEKLIAQALRDARDAQKLLKMLVAANFPPERLDIEITETCLHQNVTAVHTLVTSLKNQGIGISLDDFGTGYSSLAQLRSLPFDRIKIDRSFVANMVDDADSATIVSTIAGLGAGFNLPITAEGIDNADVLEKLRGLGRFKGQGYLYGKPAPAAETNAMLAERGLMAVLPVDPEAGRAEKDTRQAG